MKPILQISDLHVEPVGKLVLSERCDGPVQVTRTQSDVLLLRQQINQAISISERLVHVTHARLDGRVMAKHKRRLVGLLKLSLKPIHHGIRHGSPVNAGLQRIKHEELIVANLRRKAQVFFAESVRAKMRQALQKRLAAVMIAWNHEAGL